MDAMIGVIGGNGVAATNKLCQIIEENRTKTGAFRDAHHPEMVIWQATNAPSRSMYLEGRGESFIDDYVRIGRMLKDIGCSKLAMCCNTAHYAIDDLEKQIGLPFINLLDEVAKIVSNANSKKIGIMCSDGLRKHRLYDKYISKYISDCEIVYPSDKLQKLVTKGICNSKNNFRYDIQNSHEYPKSLFDRVLNYFLSEEVDTIIAGCTDIRNVFFPDSLQSNGVSYIDSLEVLAAVILREYK